MLAEMQMQQARDNLSWMALLRRFKSRPRSEDVDLQLDAIGERVADIGDINAIGNGLWTSVTGPCINSMDVPVELGGCRTGAMPLRKSPRQRLARGGAREEWSERKPPYGTATRKRGA